MDGIDTWPQRRAPIPKPTNGIENSRRPNAYFRNHRLPQWRLSARWSIKMKTNRIGTVNPRWRMKIPAIIQSLDPYRAEIIIVRCDTMWTIHIRNRPARIKTQMVIGQPMRASILRNFQINFLIWFFHPDRPHTPLLKHSDSKDASTPSNSAKHKASASSAKKGGSTNKKIRHR